MAPTKQGWLARLGSNLVARTVVYYVLVFAGAALVWRALPPEWRALIARSFGDASGQAGQAAILGRRGDAGDAGRPAGALGAAVAMTVAALLALPVGWLYILTRQKKGYRQSVVQTLIMLPVVVAGVVVLVKNSVALAFSLAGIVAAVRFRNTLEDSKDAVYIFLATALGIAAGVELGVAVVLSVVFNALALALWYSEFGKSPAALEGTRAERQLERAMAIVNRTGTFVAKVDDQLLKSMSPDQLDALADRAWRRRRRHAPELEGDEEKPDFDTLLRVRTADVEAARRAAEPVLRERLENWRFGGVIHEGGGTHVVEYDVKLGDAKPRALLDALRAGGPALLDARLHRGGDEA
ncbi:MAG: DUF4956 domain-containing protein [Gemmatimonadaceae bacterium]